MLCAGPSEECMRRRLGLSPKSYNSLTIPVPVHSRPMTVTIVEDRRKHKGRPFRIDYSKLESETSVTRWAQFAELRERTRQSYLWHLRDFLVRYAVPKLGLSESADKFLGWVKNQ